MVYLSKAEKETIILYNQTDDPVEVMTYDKKLIRRFDAFAKQHPDLCRLKEVNELGGAFYELEKSRLSIRLTAPYSDDRRKQAGDQAKKMTLTSDPV